MSSSDVRRFSIRLKLLLIFAGLITTSLLCLGLLAIRIASNAVNEKVETHLKDKATDTAEILNGRIEAFFQLMEGIARVPVFRDDVASHQEKLAILKKEIAHNDLFVEAAIVDIEGNMYHTENSKII